MIRRPIIVTEMDQKINDVALRAPRWTKILTTGYHPPVSHLWLIAMGLLDTFDMVSAAHLQKVKESRHDR